MGTHAPNRVRDAADSGIDRVGFESERLIELEDVLAASKLMRKLSGFPVAQNVFASKQKPAALEADVRACSLQYSPLVLDSMRNWRYIAHAALLHGQGCIAGELVPLPQRLWINIVSVHEFHS
jgi:hypothetical protein